MTVRWRGESPGRVSRGQRFMCYLRNPRNIIFFSGYPTGKTGDRGDWTEFYVLKFYVPFLLPSYSWIGVKCTGAFLARTCAEKPIYVSRCDPLGVHPIGVDETPEEFLKFVHF